MLTMLNFSTLKKIASAAAMTGLLAGLLLTGVQQIHVTPLIAQAELYEEAATIASPAHAHEHAHADEDEHPHEHPVVSQHEHEQEHEHGGWQPENGTERTLFTALSNISLAVGFALLLGAAFCLRGGISGWRAGLCWGLAGYTVFFFAPSLGLPPEVPGTEAAPLHDRQLWWLMTVLTTATGMSFLLLRQRWQFMLTGVVLIALPYVIGAPQPETPFSTAPAELAREFVFATATANVLFWLALGGLMGFFYARSFSSKN